MLPNQVRGTKRELESISKSAAKPCSTWPEKTRRENRQFDLVPISYGRLLPHLLNSSLIQLRELEPPPTPHPPVYDVNAKCVFHSGAPRHMIEDYKAL